MNEITLEDFFEITQQQICAESDSRDIIRSQAFFENVNEELIENGEFPTDYTYAYYDKKVGVELGGYAYDEIRQILFLVVSDYNGTNELITLNRGNIDTKFKRLKGFLRFVLNHKNIEELHEEIMQNEVFDVAQEIHSLIKAEMVAKVRMFIFSNNKATRNLEKIDNEIVDGLPIEFRVIDLGYLHRNHLLSNSGGDITIETDIPCIEIDTNNDEYSSYLGVLSGPQIVEIYELHGQRLFEQNVRTFLQFRPKVNRGIKDTLQNKPERFFAYNNGITATAKSLTFENNRITEISGLQIVNGGQTTSSIYASTKDKKNNYDLDKVNVQLKISVIRDKDKQSEFVSSVSRFANSQNAVREADFFSNSPFHKEFKDHSERIMAPASDGNQIRTRWFYERVRGDYANKQAYLTNAQRTQFRKEWPSNQKIDKIFISKGEIAWDQMPHITAQGPGKSFPKFTKLVTKKLEVDNLSITEQYYRDVISRVIMFKSIEKIISGSDWYVGDYRAQTVAYSMSYLAKIVSDKKQHFDFNKIWEIQSLPVKVVNLLENIAHAVYETILRPSNGQTNIGQYCKKEMCWDQIKSEINIKIPNDFPFLIDKETVKMVAKEEKKVKKMDKGIEVQKFVLDPRNRKIWLPLYEYYFKHDAATLKELDILKKYATGLFKYPPSEAQCLVIYNIYYVAKSEGWEG